MSANNKYITRETITYLICGALTTAVGLICFAAADFLGFATIAANTFSTVAAVLFAFVVNKIFVFRSCIWRLGLLTLELFKFCGARVITFVAETVLLVVLIDWTQLPGLPSKACTMVLVIVANYILSKYFVFKK